MMRMIGSRSSLAMRSAMTVFSGMVASAEPPRTVKSSPLTIDRAAVDHGAAAEAVGRRHRDEAVVGVVLGAAGQGADLAERAGIDQPADALADGELALAMLAIDLVGAAHLLGEILPPAQFVEFALPSLRRRRATVVVLGHPPRSPAAASAAGRIIVNWVAD